MSIQQHEPMHPGRFIQQVYIEPHKIVTDDLAGKLKVSIESVCLLLDGKMDISPVMALVLSKVLGRSPESWLQMQHNYDLQKARTKVDLADSEAIEFGPN